MKLLFQYTLDYIQRNRRSSFAIMVAVLMVTTMLSALCGMLYTIYTDNLSYYLRNSGNWHGELSDGSYGRDLAVVEGFTSVEATLIKGPWMVAAIGDPRRDYLIFRNADAAYWQSMPEGSANILEGRTPAAAGEIALSKQYFAQHPELRLGDTITLPLGDRVSPGGQTIDPQAVRREGEEFVQTGSLTLTVVARLDAATSSTVPGYTALGYLDHAAIAPDSELTIYIRFKRIGDTYKELPKIAAAVGYAPDEYGQYNLRYNSGYLTRRLVFSPRQLQSMSPLEMGQQPLMFALMGLLTAGIFVLVIHNAFALSANARLTQLGILASIGATPRQIKRSVMLEALLLSVIPLPLGLLLGQLAVRLLIERINAINVLIGSEPVTFAVGWLSVLPAILLTFLTVCWSALIPAGRIAGLSPITAIRQGELARLKKPRRHSLWERLGARLGLEGELAVNAVRARKRSYRTATVSLILSFMTLACLVCINSASEAGRSVYAHLSAYTWEEKNIELSLQNIASDADFAVTREIEAVPGVANVLWHNEQPAALRVPVRQLSPEFKAVGGFEKAKGVAVGFQPPLLRDGSYRIDSVFVGLDDQSFAEYCAGLGLEPASFYEPDRLRVILYNSIEDGTRSTRRDPVTIPFLDMQPGDRLTFTEKRRDDFEGDYTFEAEIAAVADRYPPLGSRNLAGRFGLVQFLPMDKLNELAAHFANNRAVRLTGAVLADTPEQIAAVRSGIERICESWFGSGDYTIMDYNDVLSGQQGGRMTGNLMFGFVAGLFAVIGLSNVWATVRGTLTARRREFAMLRSVGLPPRKLRKMLLYEALLLGFSPILLALPLAAVIQAGFLFINEVTFTEWLPFAPWPVLLLHIGAVLFVTCAAYLNGGRGLLRENIIEAIKLDTI